MAPAIWHLSEVGIIKGPAFMQVYDFDERIVDFINNFNAPQRLVATHYNVADPPPQDAVHKFKVFYTNPPYGSKNNGFSVIAFLARCMEMCSPVNSSGAAILPYDTEEWTRLNMHRIQRFMLDHGYLVSSMLTDMHSYHLDDRPKLRSGTIVFDRVHERTSELFGRSYTREELSRFYGAGVKAFPDRIGRDGNLVYRD